MNGLHDDRRQRLAASLALAHPAGVALAEAAAAAACAAAREAAALGRALDEPETAAALAPGCANSCSAWARTPK